MKAFGESVAGFSLCIIELIAGILLLLNPVKFTSAVIIGVGITLVILGLIEVVNYFRMSAQVAALGQMLTKGMILILAGIVCAVRWEWFLVTFPALTIVYGILFLLTGISKIQLTIDMVRLKNSRWSLAAGNAAVTLICAMIILRDPFASTEVLWLFTGAVLVGVSIFDLAVAILRKNARGDDVYEC